MNYQEAIKILMDIQNIWDDGEEHKYDAVKLGIKALEKRRPKKTISQQWNGINGVPYQNCPACGGLLWGGGTFDKKEKHCSNCGQRIDWN